MQRELHEDLHVLTLDVGSSGVRSALYNQDGHVLEGAEAHFSYSFKTSRDGMAEVDPDRLFELVVRVIDQVLKAGGNVEAVGVSTFWHSVMGIDQEGNPTTSLLSWADSRAAGAADRLRQVLDEEAVHRRTGCRLHSSYLTAKLLWLSGNQPEDFRRTRYWLSFGEYLYLRLFGKARVSTSMAAATGLFDQDKKEWDRDVLSALPISEEQLSSISDTPFSGLRGEWRMRWAALSGVPWYPAIGDGAASNVGCGCTSRDLTTLMVGTSGALRVLGRLDNFEAPKGLWRYRMDARRFVVGGALSEGGNFLSWLRNTLNLPDFRRLEPELARMQPDSHGLTILPFLTGERSPGWKDRARGIISGITLTTRPADIMRAGLEAVALRFSLLDKTLDRALPGERRLVGSGGALLGSPLLAQILSDVLGKPLTLSVVPEASSRGAALLAMEKLGVISSIQEVNAPFGETLIPDLHRHSLYRQALIRQQELYEKKLI